MESGAPLPTPTRIAVPPGGSCVGLLQRGRRACGAVRTQTLISRLELSSRTRPVTPAWAPGTLPRQTLTKHRTDHRSGRHLRPIAKLEPLVTVHDSGMLGATAEYSALAGTATDDDSRDAASAAIVLPVDPTFVTRCYSYDTLPSCGVRERPLRCRSMSRPLCAISCFSIPGDSVAGVLTAVMRDSRPKTLARTSMLSEHMRCLCCVGGYASGGRAVYSRIVPP
jgi:hypothetical protein